jgi:hypothetical protein
VTVAVDSCAVASLQLNGAALTSGQLSANTNYTMVYDGTAYQLVASFMGNTISGTLTSATGGLWNVFVNENSSSILGARDSANRAIALLGVNNTQNILLGPSNDDGQNKFIAYDPFNIEVQHVMDHFDRGDPLTPMWSETVISGGATITQYNDSQILMTTAATSGSGVRLLMNNILTGSNVITRVYFFFRAATTGYQTLKMGVYANPNDAPSTGSEMSVRLVEAGATSGYFSSYSSLHGAGAHTVTSSMQNNPAKRSWAAVTWPSTGGAPGPVSFQAGIFSGSSLLVTFDTVAQGDSHLPVATDQMMPFVEFTTAQNSSATLLLDCIYFIGVP